MNRRDLLAGAMAPLFIPRRAFGANDRPSFGIIGTGNRGGGLHTTFMKLGAECVAVCDTYEPYMERARALSPAGCKTYADYHDLIAQPGLDFVVVATPDHQHRPMLYAALKAGKDVYLEKPFSLNQAQSEEMVRTVRGTDRIVQVGMQRRSMPFIYSAKKLIDDGALGKVWHARAAWNWNFLEWLGESPLEGKLDWERFLGDAPQRPLDPKRFRWWRGFWDYSFDGRCAVDDGQQLAHLGGVRRSGQPGQNRGGAGRVHGGVRIPGHDGHLDAVLHQRLRLRLVRDFSGREGDYGDESKGLPHLQGARAKRRAMERRRRWPDHTWRTSLIAKIARSRQDKLRKRKIDLSPLEHRSCTVERDLCAKMRVLVRLTPLIAIDPP
jgi:hypothetical protein